MRIIVLRAVIYSCKIILTLLRFFKSFIKIASFSLLAIPVPAKYGSMWKTKFTSSTIQVTNSNNWALAPGSVTCLATQQNHHTTYLYTHSIHKKLFLIYMFYILQWCYCLFISIINSALICIFPTLFLTCNFIFDLNFISPMRP